MEKYMNMPRCPGWYWFADSCCEVPSVVEVFRSDGNPILWAANRNKPVYHEGTLLMNDAGHVVPLYDLEGKYGERFSDRILGPAWDFHPDLKVWLRIGEEYPEDFEDDEQTEDEKALDLWMEDADRLHDDQRDL